MALALADGALRQELKRAFASSAVAEGKLHFASYVSGRGRGLVNALQARAGLRGSELQALAKSIRDLEFYMPVESHRQHWTGEDDVIVAVALAEEAVPVGFNSQGVQISLDRLNPPALPVVVLAPVESEFGAQKQLNQSGRAERKCDIDDAATLAASSSACASVDTSSGDRGELSRLVNAAAEQNVSTVEDTAGVRMTFLRIYQDCGGECWFWGDPEYDIFTIGKRQSTDTDVRAIQCSGQNPFHADQPGIRADDFHFDQNNKFWSGRVMLMHATQVEAQELADSGRVTFELWEDDLYRCKITTNADWYGAMIADLARAVGWGAVTAWTGAKVGEDSVVSINEGASLISGYYLTLSYALRAVSHVILGNDDYIGTFVDKSETEWAGQFPDNTHIVMRGPEMTARATLTGVPDAPPYGALTRIELSADSVKLPVAHIRDLDAYGFGAYSEQVPISEPTWSSSSPGVASIDANGVVTGHSAGDAVITATTGGFQSSVPVKVRNVGEIVRVEVRSFTSYVDEGAFIQFTARGYDANGFMAPVTTSEWYSDDHGIATVTTYGRVYGWSQGQTLIHAVLDDVSGSKTVYVRAPECVPPPGQIRCDP